MDLSLDLTETRNLIFNVFTWNYNPLKPWTSVFVDNAELLLSLKNLADSFLAYDDFLIFSARANIGKITMLNPRVSDTITKVGILAQFNIFKTAKADFTIFQANHHIVLTNQIFEFRVSELTASSEDGVDTSKGTVFNSALIKGDGATIFKHAILNQRSFLQLQLVKIAERVMDNYFVGLYENYTRTEGHILSVSNSIL